MVSIRPATLKGFVLLAQAHSPKAKFFYGYWVLAIAFLYLLIVSGVGVGAFSFFVRPLQEEFGWGRGQIMTAFTIFFLLTGLASPVVGSLNDRFGVGGVATTGAILAGLAFFSLTRLQGLWHFYLAYMFIGVGTTAFGPIPASAVVSNWFKKRRGMVIGIMSAGLGVGILLIAQALSAFLIPSFGWRTAYLALGLTASLPIFLTLPFLKARPEEVGLRQYGAETGPNGEAIASTASTADGFTAREARKTPAFWLLIVSFFLGGFSAMGLSQNQVPHLQDIGFPLSKAAIALLGLGIGSAIGKFIFGWLCDHIHPRYAWAISLSLLASGVIFLLSLKSTSSVALVWLYAVFNGLGNGGWLPTMSMLVNVNFGLRSFGAILGMISLGQSVGVATGPLMAGFLFDIMQTYRWAFLIFLAFNITGIIVILSVRPPRKTH